MIAFLDVHREVYGVEAPLNSHFWVSAGAKLAVALDQSETFGRDTSNGRF